MAYSKGVHLWLGFMFCDNPLMDELYSSVNSCLPLTLDVSLISKCYKASFKFVTSPFAENLSRSEGMYDISLTSFGLKL